MSYSGAVVSNTFMQRWRSKKHIGSAAPWCLVQVRRGRLIRSYHHNWPNPQFGQIVGTPMLPQWYPDWTPLDAYTPLTGVQRVDLDQSFDKNGTTVATIECDNVNWVEKLGPAGPYHQRQRGLYWPWRGWVPTHRPGSGDAKNQWWERLPNAQILVTQGYGSDTAVKTFTGLIDTLDGQVRPDRMTISARDFGGVLSDTHLFGFNKDWKTPDPITFVPEKYWRLPFVQQDGKLHRWIKIRDATDIVRIVLRWAGFKEWEIENSGVPLAVPYTVDKSKTYMDVINDVKQQLGYVFFIGEPTNNDRSIGVPVFRRASVVVAQRSQPIALRDNDLLTDLKPKHDNKNDKYIIRVRGKTDTKIGRTIGLPAQDSARRVTFQYWPPWIIRMSGVIKQLTYYNIGDKGSIGFTSQKEAVVACLLIAMQIALGRDTATAQTPGQPALGLDGFAYVTDAGTGVASRLYITNRRSTMTIGGDGSSQVGSSGSGSGGANDLLWATEIGGSLCDNPEFEHITNDLKTALAGGKVLSWSPKGWS